MASGQMPRMTPSQMAPDGSRAPKSVRMLTTGRGDMSPDGSPTGVRGEGHRLAQRGTCAVDAQVAADARGERSGRRRLAMGHVHRARPSIGLGGMAPKWPIQVSSSVWSAWADRPVIDRTRQRTGHDRAVDPRLLARRPGQVAAEGPLALVADEQERGPRVGKQVLEVVEDPPAGQHPGRRDQDERPRAADDRLRGVHAGGACLAGVDERRVAGLEEAERLGVVALRVAEVDVVRLAGHRRVDEQGQMRDPSVPDEVVEEPDEVLGSTDGEGGDEEDAAARGPRR